MAGKLYKLSAREVSSAKAKLKPYRISDGGGLYLYIRKNGNKSWEFRYAKPTDSKKTFIGIGTFPDITLAEVSFKLTSI
ncbi:Arm DNA-binding domain-containing protein [Vibrio sp.]|uniref:DUF4102 domain-containing protein n=1 Tax=Vibrio viridaestus TaxID=2487322 RepID=A0A3N9THI0_9VIBR|nr:Arm DNA-binding domain-containing protein [Vibrio viridaestus]MDC0609587.1 Arm DNA-binding domain-containing protein [Vibrio sp.]RQW63303.1 DUF4102 domain-containing protein [Vibrio viridaestus]